MKLLVIQFFLPLINSSLEVIALSPNILLMCVKRSFLTKNTAFCSLPHCCFTLYKHSIN
jgi:hypothetical protein